MDNMSEHKNKFLHLWLTNKIFPVLGMPWNIDIHMQKLILNQNKY